MKSTTFSQARQGFRFANQTENKSVKTIEWYDDALERFETWLLKRSLDQSLSTPPLLKDLTTDDIRQFIAYLQGKTTCYEGHPTRQPEQRALSPYTIRGVVSTLSAFFHWCVEEGLLTKSPMEKIVKPKVPKIIKERFSEEDVRKLIDTCKEYPAAIAARNRALLLFLLDTGVRAAEICSLTLDRLDLEHGRAHVTGKGSKDREVFLGKNARRVLWQYITVHRPGHGDATHVFLTSRAAPITTDELGRILRHLGERAGVAHVHPHRFRHTAARLFIRNGGDAFSLQRLLGHEGLETTRRYVELEREDIEKAHERASPVDHWGLH